MGNVLGVNKAEERLHPTDSNQLNFVEYLNLLKSEFFKDGLLHTSPNAEKIKEMCWMLYKCKAWEISNQQKLQSNDAFILWKIFNFLCEMDESGAYSLPLVMDRDEIELLFERFALVTGQQADQNSMKNVLHNGTLTFPFPKILALFERQYLGRLRDDEISLGLSEVHEEIIDDMMKKGFMSKKGNNIAPWKERFFILKPKCMYYYTGPDLKDQKGFIEINTDCFVVPTADKACRFSLRTSQKNYEFQVSDMKTKNEWISALQKAIDANGEAIHFQKIELSIRSNKRIAIRQKEAEDSLQRQKELQAIEEKTKELMEEKQARAEAEAKLQLESTLREADKDHLKELKEIKEELERLLKEERQAKRDEELVRIAQTRVLKEEFEKREELENLKKKQEQLLAEEQLKREGIEQEMKFQASLLTKTSLELEKLENERRIADQRLENAMEKIRHVEVERSKMELRMKYNTKPIGLARPVMPQVRGIITHRGYGAFVTPQFDCQTLQKHTTDNVPVSERENRTGDAKNNFQAKELIGDLKQNGSVEEEKEDNLLQELSPRTKEVDYEEGEDVEKDLIDFGENESEVSEAAAATTEGGDEIEKEIIAL